VSDQRWSSSQQAQQAGFTVISYPFTTLQFENSEVSLLGSVAVAAMNSPGGTAKAKRAVKCAFPLLSVVTVIEPRNVCPSPKPDGSHAVFAKNSSVKVVFGVLVNDPTTSV